MADRMVNQLRALLAAMGPKYGVRRAMLFGSHARGDALETSDVDLVVEFDSATTFDRFMGLKLDLEDATGKRVDLVTFAAMKPAIRTHVEREWLRVA
ncbi:MAG: nucleotidyltransferase family protein [Phycisphaerales bacterium]